MCPCYFGSLGVSVYLYCVGLAGLFSFFDQLWWTKEFSRNCKQAIGVSWTLTLLFYEKLDCALSHVSSIWSSLPMSLYHLTLLSQNCIEGLDAWEARLVIPGCVWEPWLLQTAFEKPLLVSEVSCCAMWGGCRSCNLVLGTLPYLVAIALKPHSFCIRTGESYHS